jgi:F-type H+-transporting ATPase subunit b
LIRWKVSDWKAPRRLLGTIVLGLALAACALPQEPAKAAETSDVGEGGSWIWWKWANFALLAGGLAYLIGKSVPAMFRKQAADIQTALREAAKTKEEAAAYAAGIEGRLKNLQTEIEKLRQSAHSDMSGEAERIRLETQHHLQRIREQAAQEMELLTRSAKDELQKFTSELALTLAEQRIRTRLNPAMQQELAEGFLRDLHKRGIQQAAN